MYEIYKDVDGSPYAVDLQTGEITDAITITVPARTKIYTPEQQAAYKQYQRRIAEKTLKQHYQQLAQDELGYFYFLLCENQLGKIPAETTARLIYLCTYVDRHGRLMKTNKTPMQKSDLKEILGLSATAIYYFWKDVNPLYIVEDTEGLRVISKEITRGKIKDNHQCYKRCYIKQIRKIYEATEPIKHKNLGYVFQLLPYINNEWNILCWNPREPNIDSIVCFSVKDLCEMIGYNYDNAGRLVDRYDEITFNVNGHEEYFLSFVINNRHFETGKIFVNPKILYSGSDYEKVEVLGTFTKKRNETSIPHFVIEQKQRKNAP